MPKPSNASRNETRGLMGSETRGLMSDETRGLINGETRGLIDGEIRGLILRHPTDRNLALELKKQKRKTE